MHARPWTDLRLLVPGFTLGVLAVHALAKLPTATTLSICALTLLLPWRGRWLLAATWIGVSLTALQAETRLADRWPIATHGEDHWVQGRIASLPERQPQGEGRVLWRFLLEPDAEAFPSRVRVAWYRSEETVRGGECWRFELRLRTPRGSLNPGAFDYEQWLFAQGIGATATVRDAQRCETRGSYTVLRVRQWFADRIRGALPEHPAQALLLALTVGDRSGFTDADWTRFRATGTSHLVAISGLHVGIVSGVAFFLFRWLWSAWPWLCLRVPAQRAGMVGAALCAGAYALVAGFQPPVVRAVLMLWLLLAALWWNRFSQPSRVLALAWLLILLADPFAVMAPGLWLSFLGVAAIFYVVMHRLRPPGVLRGLVVIQVALSLLLAPMTLLFFNGVSWMAPLVNLVAVPLFTLLAPLALGSVLLHAVVPVLGQPMLELSAFLLQWFNLGLDTAAAAPQSWSASARPWPVLALMLFGGVLLFCPRGLPLRPLALLCFLPLLFADKASPTGGLEVTTLDVGQGLAVVVRTENHTLLYDAGPAWPGGFDAGASVVAPYLLGQGIRSVDLLFLSHGDNDHAGGSVALRQLVPVHAELGTPGRARCVEGMRWEWDGVRFEVLHPGAGDAAAGNNGSCVLHVDGPFTVLLAGDIERGAESRLLRRHPERLNVDVLVAPHHGSKTSSTADFVEATSPQLAIFSAGWRHHFGHPHPTVVARYKVSGSRTIATADSGAVRAWQSGEALQVGEYRSMSRRFWHAPSGN